MIDERLKIIKEKIDALDDLKDEFKTKVSKASRVSIQDAKDELKTLIEEL
jgi:hypothetical protein